MSKILEYENITNALKELSSFPNHACKNNKSEIIQINIVQLFVKNELNPESFRVLKSSNSETFSWGRRIKSKRIQCILMSRA